MGHSILLAFLLLVSGAFASGVPGIDSIPDPDGIQHAFWHGWVPGLKGLAWIKARRWEGVLWKASMPNGWARGGRTWHRADFHRPLYSGRYARWPTRSTIYAASAPLPELDSDFYWRSEPSLLDTATPLSLPGAGWIRWTGRYFWTAPESLWAEGRLESKSECLDSVAVEALLPTEFVDRPQNATEFRPRLLRIALFDELELNDGMLRSNWPLLLIGPPEMTVPVVIENDRNDEDSDTDEDSGTTRKTRHRVPPSPFSLLLHIDGNGYHDVESVSWLPTLRVNSKRELPQILSRKNGVTFSVDPVVPNLSRLPVVSDSAWRTAFRPDPAEGHQEWIAGNWGLRPLVDLHVQRHAFLDAFVMAWNEHRAVRLSPDAVWMFLLEGLLTTTRKDPGSVRGEMVLYDTGKVRLEVQLDEDFPSRIHQNVAWDDVVSQLLDSMDRHTVDHRQQKLQPHFSTTTPSRALATKIRILELYQDYFDYNGVVGCGIPSIHLEGSPSDWKLLRSQVKALSINSTRAWVDGVIPILDQFVAASEGKPDGKFWKAFVRFHARAPNCGSVDKLDGWITRLVNRSVFKSDDSTYVPPKWDERLRLSYLQRDHGSVPFLLRSGREERHFQFVSGFSGVRQDPDGALAPELGWAVWETKNEATPPEGKP